MKVTKILEATQILKYNIQRRRLINQLNNTIILAKLQMTKMKNITDEASNKIGTIINIYI